MDNLKVLKEPFTFNRKAFSTGLGNSKIIDKYKKKSNQDTFSLFRGPDKGPLSFLKQENLENLDKQNKYRNLSIWKKVHLSPDFNDLFDFTKNNDKKIEFKTGDFSICYTNKGHHIDFFIPECTNPSLKIDLYRDELNKKNEQGMVQSTNFEPKNVKNSQRIKTNSNELSHLSSYGTLSTFTQKKFSRNPLLKLKVLSPVIQKNVLLNTEKPITPHLFLSIFNNSYFNAYLIKNVFKIFAVKQKTETKKNNFNKGHAKQLTSYVKSFFFTKSVSSGFYKKTIKQTTTSFGSGLFEAKQEVSSRKTKEAMQPKNELSKTSNELMYMVSKKPKNWFSILKKLKVDKLKKYQKEFLDSKNINRLFKGFLTEPLDGTYFADSSPSEEKAFTTKISEKMTDLNF